MTKTNKPQAAKHTEGPWIITGDGAVRGAATEPYESIARLSGPNKTANGYLIAAAPDLLEALKAALNEITGEVDKCPDPEPMIRAAIAKADGR